MQNSSQQKTAQDLEAVITSFNQGEMIREAVQSLCSQTVLPGKIILVDDGSSEEKSLTVLKQIEKDRTLPVKVEILRQANGGVSAARNAGILRTQTPLVLILDGDGIDKRNSHDGQIKTRLEAFLEMIGTGGRAEC